MSLLRDCLLSFVGKFWNKHIPPPSRNTLGTPLVTLSRGSHASRNPYLYSHLYYNIKPEQKTFKTERSFSLRKRKYSVPYLVQNHIKLIDLRVPLLRNVFPVLICIMHLSLVLKMDNEDQKTRRSWIYSFSSLNSCINPFIYALQTKRLKKSQLSFLV